MVEGDYACFTRPEMKVERVSYDVPTPGALEGMLNLDGLTQSDFSSQS